MKGIKSLIILFKSKLIKNKIFTKDKPRLSFGLEIIENLKNKGTGPASIPLSMLKVVSDIIVVPLCHIRNLSFSTGVFPNALKVAKVIPLHKGGSTQDMNNFRPISLLSIFDKIFEKIMHKKLYDFLIVHEILFYNQFGFQKNNSSSHSMIEISESIKETIDGGKFGCGMKLNICSLSSPC